MKTPFLSKKTASNLLKLRAKTKLYACLAFCFLALQHTLFCQTYPRENRIHVSLNQILYSSVPENIFISPQLSAGITVEFRQLYAYSLALNSSYILHQETFVPLLGLNYDLSFKLFRSEPRRVIIPISNTRFLKSWALTGAGDETGRALVDDLSNVRFQQMAGAEIKTGSIYWKVLGGINVLLGPRYYFTGAVSPSIVFGAEW